MNAQERFIIFWNGQRMWLSDKRDKNVLGNDVKHRDRKYMNNRMEQNHRGTKSRTNPMKGFKDSWCAMIFCHTFEEIRQFFYMPNKTTAPFNLNFTPQTSHLFLNHHKLMTTKAGEFFKPICTENKI